MAKQPGYEIIEENGRTYYVYAPTGFKTTHLRYMLNHIENRTGVRPSAPNEAAAKEIGEPWAEPDSVTKARGKPKTGKNTG